MQGRLHLIDQMLHHSGIFTVTSLFQILGHYFNMLDMLVFNTIISLSQLAGGLPPPRDSWGGCRPPTPPFGGIRREKSVQFAGIRRQIAPPVRLLLQTAYPHMLKTACKNNSVV